MPLGVALDGANRHELKLSASTGKSQPPAVTQLWEQWTAAEVAQHRCLVAGYDYAEGRQIVAAHLTWNRCLLG